jgi:hypothetical protein
MAAINASSTATITIHVGHPSPNRAFEVTRAMIYLPRINVRPADIEPAW